MSGTVGGGGFVDGLVALGVRRASRRDRQIKTRKKNSRESTDSSRANITLTSQTLTQTQSHKKHHKYITQSTHTLDVAAQFQYRHSIRAPTDELRVLLQHRPGTPFPRFFLSFV